MIVRDRMIGGMIESLQILQNGSRFKDHCGRPCTITVVGETRQLSKGVRVLGQVSHVKVNPQFVTSPIHQW